MSRRTPTKKRTSVMHTSTPSSRATVVTPASPAQNSPAPITIPSSPAPVASPAASIQPSPVARRLLSPTYTHTGLRLLSSPLSQSTYTATSLSAIFAAATAGEKDESGEINNNATSATVAAAAATATAATAATAAVPAPTVATPAPAPAPTPTPTPTKSRPNLTIDTFIAPMAKPRVGSPHAPTPRRQSTSGVPPTTPSSRRMSIPISPVAPPSPTTPRSRISLGNVATTSRENLRVIVRVRAHVSSSVTVTSTGQHDTITVDGMSFHYDHVMDQDTSQQQMYAGCGATEIVEDVVTRGYNATILAYGQTSSGKTFTMMGLDEPTPPIDPALPPPPPPPSPSPFTLTSTSGIIPRAISQLFERIATMNDKCECTVTLSYLELYNERVYDLLSPGGERVSLDIREYTSGPRTGAFYVPDLSRHVITDASQTMSLIARGTTNRQVASTLFNRVSSRGHTVITVAIEQKMFDESKALQSTITSHLNLVDLAGSEKYQMDLSARDTQSTETNCINQSLHFLGNVICALTSHNPGIIPYRNSKLTKLLKDSLGGNARTLFVACVNPEAKQSAETINTLKYADRAKQIRNKPRVNKESTRDAMILQLTQEIESLRTNLQKHREMEQTMLEMVMDDDVNNDVITTTATATATATATTTVKAATPSNEDIEPESKPSNDENVPPRRRVLDMNIAIKPTPKKILGVHDMNIKHESATKSIPIKTTPIKIRPTVSNSNAVHVWLNPTTSPQKSSFSPQSTYMLDSFATRLKTWKKHVHEQGEKQKNEQSKLEQITMEKNKLQLRLCAYQLSHQKQSRTIDTLTHDLLSRDTQLVAAMERMSKVETRIATVEHERDTVNQQYQMAQHHVTQLTAENDAHIQHLEQIQMKLHTLEITSHDEIKLLEEQLNEMNDKLQTSVKEKQERDDIINKMQEEMKSMSMTYDEQIIKLTNDMETSQIAHQQQINKMNADMETARASHQQQINKMNTDMETARASYEQQINQMKADADTVRASYEQQINKMNVDMETARVEHQQQINKMNADMETTCIAHDEHIKTMTSTWNIEQDILIEAHAAAMSRASELENAVLYTQQQMEQRMNEMVKSHEEAIQVMKTQHEDVIRDMTTKHENVIQNMTTQHDNDKAVWSTRLDQQKQETETAMELLRQQHQDEMTSMKQTHADTVAKLQAQHDQLQQHQQIITLLRSEMETQQQQHQHHITSITSTWNNERDEMMKNYTDNDNAWIQRLHEMEPQLQQQQISHDTATQTLQSQITTLEAEHTTTINTMTSSHTSEINAWTSKYDDMKLQYHTLEQQYDAKQVECDQLKQSHHDEMQSHVTTWDVERQALQQTQADWESKYQAAITQHQQVIDTINNDHISHITRMEEDHSATIQQLHQQMDEMRTKHIMDIDVDIKHAQQQYHTLYDQFIHERTKHMNEMKSVQQQRDDIQQMLYQTCDELRTLHADISSQFQSQSSHSSHDLIQQLQSEWEAKLTFAIQQGEQALLKAVSDNETLRARLSRTMDECTDLRTHLQSAMSSKSASMLILSTELDRLRTILHHISIHVQAFYRAEMARTHGTKGVASLNRINAIVNVRETCMQAITESATVDACSTALVSAQQAVAKQASRSRTLTMVTRPSRAVSTDTGVNVIGSVARTSQLLAESNVVAPTAGRSCEIM